MKHSRRSLLAAAGVSAIIGPSAIISRAGAASPRKITFLVDGGPVGRHSYYFLAASKGYYAQEGLEVGIIGGKGSAAVVKEVASGSATMGFADAGTMILARGNEDVPVKMVAVVYNSAPHAMIVLEESGIRKPADLMGKTLSDVAGSANYLLFPAYAKVSGIDPTKVKWVFADFNALPGMLVTRQVDAIGQFTIGLPLLEKRAKPKSLVALAYRDAGLDFYSNGIIVRDEMLQKEPDLVRAFLRATQKGLRDAIADPDAAGAAIHKALPLVETDAATDEMRQVAQIAQSAGTRAHGLGWLDSAKMQQTIDVIAGVSTLKKKPAVTDVMADGFVSP